MAAWTTFWGIFLIVALSLFAGISIVVSIGGFADLRKLFSDLDDDNEAAMAATSAKAAESVDDAP